MDLELDGRVAVVTGASVGIGRGIAKVLASEGAQTVVVARRGELLESLAAEIEREGFKRPMVVLADLYDTAQPDRVQQAVAGRFGHADILVNNAGGSRTTTLLADDEVWNESFALNFTCTRKLTQAFLPAMRERKWGRIVNITGTMEPFEMNAANAAKSAVHAWAKGVSRTIARDNVTINCLAPGRIQSEQLDRHVLPDPERRRVFVETQIPAGYIGEPSDMAYMTAFLCSPKARYVTGQRIYVDGGLHRAV